ncbi:DUF4259 domain-containing protein [Pseudonocardia sp. TRM90224]|uniref:DUF4259 domain-containing protein n=1 Tax=Pseudonocardia sp. TRM90224 TaxID=2812678 RepID=UPI001E4ED6E2|nr:DUF4259 domain-containing protein [Pseudonocardia sp. TRM90224]
MGTWGTGPFGSDGACDALAGWARRPPDERQREIQRLLIRVLDEPAAMSVDYFPDEVVAAVALVAAATPAGGHLLDAVPEASAAALPTSTSALAAVALDALAVVGGPDGPWHQGWSTTADQVAARQTTDELESILRAVR